MNLQKKKIIATLSLDQSLQIEDNLALFFQKSPKFLAKAREVINGSHHPEKMVESIQSFCTTNGIDPAKIPEPIFPLLIKLMSVVRYSLDVLMPDIKIPDEMKPYLSVENITKFGSMVFTKTGNEPFKNGRALLQKYNELVLKIQDHLVQNKNHKALEFKPRKEFLFDWCRVLIELTSHPILLKKMQDADYMAENSKKLDSLFSAQAKFVLFIVIVDDVADIMQDRKLLEYFTSIPKLSKEALAKEKLKMESSGYGHFVEFFEFCFQVWVEAHQETLSLIAINGSVRNFENELSESMKKVMKSMWLSVAINDTSGLYEGDYEDVEEKLSVNMLMTFFKVIETNLLKSEGESVLAHVKDSLNQIFATGEIIGHSGNNVATFMREIRNGDISNTLILIVDEILKAELKIRGIDFRLYVQLLLGKGNHHIPDVDTFLKLTTECSKSNERIFALIAHLCEQNELNFADIVKEISEIQDQSGIDRLSNSPQLALLKDTKEFLEIVDELKRKVATLKIVSLILEDPKLTPLCTYYERINGYFNKMKAAASEISTPGLDLYIDGVYRSFVMSLLLKSDM